MDIKVTGNAKLRGNVTVSGSKNAAIPIICASLLAKGKVLLRNVPRISDIENLIQIIKNLDCRVIFKGHTMLIDNANLKYKPLLFEECQKIRGSYYLIGVFLTLFSKCEILLPGGCRIGNRPIDLHLKAFEDFGFSYTINENILYITKKRAIHTANLAIEKKSVGASINAMLSGLNLECFEIKNVHFEPEGLDLINFLNKIGYSLRLDNHTLSYERKELTFKLLKHTIIPDRIEAMTYVVMGLLCGTITIKKVDTGVLKYPLELLKRSSFNIKYTANEINTFESYGKPFEIKTEVYPMFPTDLQPLFGVLSVNVIGQSQIEECIFENRMHIYYDLIDSGVNCNIKNNKAIIEGKRNIVSKNYKAYDLRHGAGLLILALKGDGTSVISNFEYVLRGYESILKKVSSLGAEVKILS